jgi:hypothetical protein
VPRAGGGKFDDLWALYLPIGVAVAVIVCGLVLFALVRHRPRDDDLSGGREGPPIIEGLCALLLAGVVIL